MRTGAEGAAALGSKRGRTREALLSSATTLFRVQGYDATTVEQIASGAGVTSRTFFRYFATKDAVVFANAESRFAAFVAALRGDGADGAPLVGVTRAFRETVREFSEHRHELVLQHRVIESSATLIAKERELDRRWEGALAAHLGGGDADPALARRARLLAGAFMGAARATLSEWYATDGKQDLPLLAEETMTLLSGPSPTTQSHFSTA